MLSDLRRKQLRAFLRNRVSVVGTIMTLLIVLMALFAGWLSPYDPLDQNVYERLTSPDSEHLFGTDSYGRDTFSRAIWGSRISLIRCRHYDVLSGRNFCDYGLGRTGTRA
jgi:peptide/nickel transport system permease protein